MTHIELIALRFAKHLTGESLEVLKTKFEDWDKAQKKAKQQRLEQSAEALKKVLPERRKQDEKDFSLELNDFFDTVNENDTILTKKSFTQVLFYSITNEQNRTVTWPANTSFFVNYKECDNIQLIDSLEREWNLSRETINEYFKSSK